MTPLAGDIMLFIADSATMAKSAIMAIIFLFDMYIATVNYIFCASILYFWFLNRSTEVLLGTFNYASHCIGKREEEVFNRCDVDQLTTCTSRATHPCVCDTTDKVQEPCKGM